VSQGGVNDVDELIERMFLDVLDEAESIRLEALLMAEESLRDDFREAAALDAALRTVACGRVADAAE
jgi:hypothetical protein